MKTPEEAVDGFAADQDAAPGWGMSEADRDRLAALIRARDAEVAEAARAEALTGFVEERAKFWEHDEGTGRLRRASTGVVCTRLVGPWEPEP